MAGINFNKGEAQGNLTKDPKVFENKNGSKTVMLTLACNWKSKNGEGTDYVPVKWIVPEGKDGLLPYLTKGKEVYVEFTPRLGQSYTDANGETVYPGVELMVRRIIPGRSPQGAAEAPAAAQPTAAVEQVEAVVSAAPGAVVIPEEIDFSNAQ